MRIVSFLLTPDTARASVFSALKRQISPFSRLVGCPDAP